jgi:xanthine dehydrogenase small subunit
VRRAGAAEAALAGQPAGIEPFARAGAVLGADFQPLDDMRASSAYRLAGAAGLLRRAGHQLFGDGARPVTRDALHPAGGADAGAAP